MKIKNKKKLLSAVIAMLCAANTCAVSMPIMAGAEETSTVVGDANLDGVLNVRDAAFIAKYISERKEDELSENADFNGDANINVRDAAAIGKAIARELTNEAGGKAIERDTHDYASISLGETIAVPGETVSIPVNVTCNNNFESAAFLVEWENAGLSSASVNSSYLRTSVGYEVGVNCVSAAVYSYEAIADGEIATIEVTIPEGAVAGTEYKLNITKIETFAEFEGEDLADTVSVSGGSIVVSPKLAESISIYEDESYEFSDDYDVCEIVSANKAVATITNNVITAVSAGTTLIEYYADEKLLGTSTLIIKEIEEFEIGVNQQKFIYTAETSPEYVEWEISDSSVVAIENGILTGLEEGTAEITGTYNGKICYRGVATVVKDAVVTTPPVETTTTTKATTTTTTATTVSTTLTEITTSANEDGQIIGDVNLDGVLNIRDAAALASYLAKIYSTSNLTIPENADYDGNGEIRVRDVAAIAKAVANNLAYNRSETKLERNGSSSAKLSIGNVATARAGETISVPVKVECGDNFESGAFVIGWNSSELTLSSCYPTNGVSGFNITGDGYCAFNAYSSLAVADGEIAIIEFTIPADAKIGDTYEIYFTDVETFAEFEGEDLADTVNISSGTVTVVPKADTEYFVSEGEEIDLSDYSMFDITTSDSEVATVVKNTLTGVSAGVTYIQFALEDYAVESKVMVMSPAETELMVGEQKFIYASDDASELTWISEDLTVATVKNGNVTAVAEGTTNIYAIDKESGKYVYSGTVTVTERTAVTTAPDTDTPTTTTKIQSVDVDEVVPAEDDYSIDDIEAPAVYVSKVSGMAGETVPVEVRVKTPDNISYGLDATVTWADTSLTASGESGALASEMGENYINFVSISPSGFENDDVVETIYFDIPADAESGTEYEIDVYANSLDSNGEHAENVNFYSGKITVINSRSKTININENDTAVLTGDYDKYTEVFTSDDSIAYLEDDTIYAVSSGTAYITLSNETESFEITVNVCTPSSFDIDVYSGKEINIPEIDNSDLIWTSSNNTVATVSEEGYVYGYKRGTATISAYDPDTGKVVWTGTANVINGIKYGDNLYYEKMDNDDDGVDDYVNIVGCEETATSVHIPAEIDGLPVEAIYGFYECTELAEITVDEEVTNMGSDTFEDTAWFKKQKEENTFVVLNSVLLDGHNFEGETLEIPEDITVVGNSAFGGMENLKNVIVPENVVKVGIAGFGYCENLETITFENPECELLMPLGSMTPTEEITIRGYEGSTAQEFAEATGYSFALIGEEAVTTTVTTSTSTTTETTISTTVSEDTTTTEPKTTTTVTTTVSGEESAPLCGDANDDGDVTVRDCATIARLLAENKKDELPAWADFNGDGEVSVRDAAGLSRAIATKTLVKEPYVPVNEGWRAAYKEFAKNVTADDIASGAEANLSYVLYNIDDDNIPELVVFGSIGFTAFYSWNETDGIYKIGENFICNNAVPGYYDDNGEFGITAHYWRQNFESQGYYTFEINGNTYVEESIGSTTTYHVEGMGEDTVCERGEEYFTELDTVSLDGKVSLDEYFDNWTK